MPLGATIAVWLALAPASAQTAANAHGLAIGDLGSELDAPVLSPWTATTRKGAGWVGLAIDYADRPWVSPFEGVLLDDLTTLSLAGGYAPWERVRVTAAMPLHLGSTVDSGTSQGTVPGDARLAVHPVLWSGQRAELGAVVAGTLPTGAPRSLLGRGGPSLELLAATTLRPGPLRLSGTAGPALRPAVSREEGTGPGHALLGSAALGWAPTELLSLGTELMGDVPLAASARGVTGYAVELAATARVASRRGVVATFGVGAGPTRAAGSPASRLIFGLAWSPRPSEPEPEPEVVVEVEEPAPQPLEVVPEYALVWLPHPICQWLPFTEARGRLKDLPPGTEIQLAAPGFLPASATVDGGLVELQPAPPKGGMVVLTLPGDRVRVDGELLGPSAGGVSILGMAEGSHTVSVEGAGRIWEDEAAMVEGYALWLRAPAPEPMGLTFRVGSSRLEPDAIRMLEALIAHPGDHVYELRGSYSPEGERKDNRRLAAARAATVAMWLRDHGLPAAQIRVLAGTEPDPGYDAREQRRVDVTPTGRAR